MNSNLIKNDLEYRSLKERYDNLELLDKNKDNEIQELENYCNKLCQGIDIKNIEENNINNNENEEDDSYDNNSYEEDNEEDDEEEDNDNNGNDDLNKLSNKYYNENYNLYDKEIKKLKRKKEEIEKMKNKINKYRSIIENEKKEYLKRCNNSPNSYEKKQLQKIKIKLQNKASKINEKIYKIKNQEKKIQLREIELDKYKVYYII